MAVRPIPFSDPMSSALREGRKTQTRRALVLRGHASFSEFGPSNTAGYECHFRDAEQRWHDLTHDELFSRLPYAVGDRLYVRETYYQCGHWEPIAGAKTKGGKQKWGFVADAPYVKFDMFEPYLKAMDRVDPTTPAWHKRLGRFMPRAASRMTLIVTDVRVQRLHEISVDDAVAEGIEDVTREIACRDPSARFWKRYRDGGWNGYVDDPIGSYASLWTEINGAGSWEANPWVTAISFTVHHCNISKMEHP